MTNLGISARARMAPTWGHLKHFARRWCWVRQGCGTPARGVRRARGCQALLRAADPFHYQRLPPAAREPLPARYPPPDRKPPPLPRGADGLEISTLMVRPPSA